MASISSLGAGSGLDLSGILNNLMSVEQQPLVNLQKKEASYQARISGLGSLKSVLSSLQTAAGNLLPATGKTMAEKYSAYSAKVTDTAIATATATSSSVPGTYSLEVSALAYQQRIATTTPGAPPTSPYADASAVIAQGTLTIEFGSLSGGTYTADSTRKLDIVIDSSNATLGGLRDAINKANGGVSAAIVTGTAGAQLVLTSKETGTKNVMQLSGLTGFDYNPVTATGSFTQDAAQGGQAATDAALKVNGIAATSSSNVVSGVLEGVSLTLLKTGGPTSVSVSKDTTTALSSALSAFVKSYNEANTMLNNLGAYDAKTKEAGVLQGQAVVRGTQSQLRNLVFGTATGGTSAYQHLTDIGISFDKAGALTLDSSKLSKALEADYDNVLTLVENVGGAFKTSMESLVGTSGTVNGMTESINRMIKDIGKQRTVLNERILRIEERYRAQFTALDTAISGMKQTSSYLTQQLANLPGVGS